VTKGRDSDEEGRVFTCSNPVCGRTFSVPIKVVDLRVSDPRPSLACPHCLGRIAPDVDSRVDDSSTNDAKETVDNKPEQPREIGNSVERPITKCAFHLGFLSERSSKEKMPEDCIVCENIIKCMLKAVRD